MTGQGARGTWEVDTFPGTASERHHGDPAVGSLVQPTNGVLTTVLREEQRLLEVSDSPLGRSWEKSLSWLAGWLVPSSQSWASWEWAR